MQSLDTAYMSALSVSGHGTFVTLLHNQEEEGRRGSGNILNIGTGGGLCKYPRADISISEYLSKSSTFAISITHSPDVKSRIDKFLILSLHKEGRGISTQSRSGLLFICC